ncbi:MAG: 6-phosphogluconolactonase, partial [Chloroflexota bacterium]|nr:6-phosphogluconolactonase [Chloroflexota bacterium]
MRSDDANLQTEDPLVLDAGIRGRVIVHQDAEALAHAAAREFARITAEAVIARSRAFVALSGGSTPKRMGELLATTDYQDRVPWQDLHILWGDERWVPEESEESNAGVARRTFLSKVPLPIGHIHPFPTEGLE